MKYYVPKKRRPSMRVDFNDDANAENIHTRRASFRQPGADSMPPRTVLSPRLVASPRTLQLGSAAHLLHRSVGIQSPRDRINPSPSISPLMENRTLQSSGTTNPQLSAQLINAIKNELKQQLKEEIKRELIEELRAELRNDFKDELRKELAVEMKLNLQSLKGVDQEVSVSAEEEDPLSDDDEEDGYGIYAYDVSQPLYTFDENLDQPRLRAKSVSVTTLPVERIEKKAEEAEIVSPKENPMMKISVPSLLSSSEVSPISHPSPQPTPGHSPIHKEGKSVTFFHSGENESLKRLDSFHNPATSSVLLAQRRPSLTQRRPSLTDRTQPSPSLPHTSSFTSVLQQRLNTLDASSKINNRLSLRSPSHATTSNPTTPTFYPPSSDPSLQLKFFGVQRVATPNDGCMSKEGSVHSSSPRDIPQPNVNPSLWNSPRINNDLPNDALDPDQLMNDEFIKLKREFELLAN